MIRTKAFSKYNVTLNSIPHSKCKNFTSETDEYWECALRHVAGTLHHQVNKEWNIEK